MQRGLLSPKAKISHYNSYERFSILPKKGIPKGITSNFPVLTAKSIGNTEESKEHMVFSPKSNIRPINSNNIVDLLPTLGGITPANYNKILKKKLEICSHQCDFDSPRQDDRAIFLKTKTLQEVLAFIKKEDFLNTVDLDWYKLITDMILRNIIRVHHPKVFIQTSSEDRPIEFLANWDHLQIAYTILHELMKQKRFMMNSQFSVVESLINNLATQDQRERSQIIEIILEYLQISPGQLKKVVEKLTQILSRYIDGMDEIMFIEGILSTLNAIFNSFVTRDSMTMFIEVANTYIVPLLYSSQISLFQEQIFTAVKLFLKIGKSGAALFIIKCLVNHWPHSGSGKQIFYLLLLAESYTLLQYNQRVQVYKSCLKILVSSIQSESARLSEAALQHMTSPIFQVSLREFSDISVSVLHSPVSYVAQNHWYSPVRDKAIQLLSILISLESRLESCSMLSKPTQPHISVAKWRAIILQAAQNNPEIKSYNHLQDLRVRIDK